MIRKYLKIPQVLSMPVLSFAFLCGQRQVLSAVLPSVFSIFWQAELGNFLLPLVIFALRYLAMYFLDA